MNLHDRDIIREAKKEGARENAIETAKKFLAMGLSVEQVAQGTRLSVEDIQNFVKEKILILTKYKNINFWTAPLNLKI